MLISVRNPYYKNHLCTPNPHQAAIWALNRANATGVRTALIIRQFHTNVIGLRFVKPVGE